MRQDCDRLPPGSAQSQYEGRRLARADENRGADLCTQHLKKLTISRPRVCAQLDLDKHEALVIADGSEAEQELGANGFASRVRRTRDAVRVQ